MAKIFIISNTNFNISKNISSKEWLKNQHKYFYDDFIPFLKDNVDDNDILIHLGNFLCKSKSIDLNVLNFIQKLFEDISNILPIYIIESENDKLSLNILKNFKNINIIKESKKISSDITILNDIKEIQNIDELKNNYCFFNNDYLNLSNKDILINKLKIFKKCYNGYYDKNSVTDNIKNLGAPYNIESDTKKGFIILDTKTNKDRFISNKTSPIFKKISICNDSDLDISPELFKNNYISLNINKKVLANNKIKVDMIISSNNITNVTYSDDDIIKDKESMLELNEDSLTLKEMVIDYINKSYSENKDDILKEFENIIELNKK